MARFDLTDFRMVCDPTAVAEQAARGTAGGRSPGAQWHLLAAAHRGAMGRHSGAIWTAHDLREPRQPMAAGRRVGPASRGCIKGLRRRDPDDRLAQHPCASARCRHPKKDDRSRYMGRSLGGLTTKIHVLVDATGLPVALKLTEGQAHDGRAAWDMLGSLAAGNILLADRAYDSDTLRRAFAERGAWANVKPMPNRRKIPALGSFPYDYRDLVERFFNKLKHFRAVETRYDKSPENYLASARIRIRVNGSMA